MVPYIHYYYTLCHYVHGMLWKNWDTTFSEPYTSELISTETRAAQLAIPKRQRRSCWRAATDTLNNKASSSGNLPWMCHESLPKDLNLPSICHEFASKSFRPGVGNCVPSNLSNNMQQSSKLFKVHDATDESHGLHFQSLEAIAGT